MHFSEEDIRAALQRKSPGEDFTDRVMARIGQQARKPARLTFGEWLTAALRTMMRPAMAGALAAVLVVAAVGVGWWRHDKVVAEARARSEQAQAEAARDQAVLALQITRSKLDHVLRRAKFNAERTSSPRKESL